MTMQASSNDRVVHWWAVLACLSLLTACSIKRDLSLAEAATETFHHRLAASDNDAIFAEATPEYQKTMTNVGNRAFLSRLRRTLGAPRSSRLLGLHENHMPSGTFVVGLYSTHFEEGEAQETFTWRLQDGALRLSGYGITSPLLTP